VRVLVAHSRYRSSSASGENRVVDVEVAALRAAGHEVVLFQRHSDDFLNRSQLRQAALAPGTVWNRHTRAALRARVRSVRPDVVHVHNIWPLLSPSVLSAPGLEAVPSVVTLHNYQVACPVGTFQRGDHPCHECADDRLSLGAVRHGCVATSPAVALAALSKAVNLGSWKTAVSAYVFLSDAQRRHLLPVGLPPGRAFVKWNLVPDPSIQGPPAQFTPTIVYIGRLNPVKGIDVLLRAWDLARTAMVDAGLRLVLIGDGPLRSKVEAWAAERAEVDVHGSLPHQDAMRLLAGARAAVVPSTWPEPFGLSAVEAMATGVPVIASGHGALAELVRPGVDGQWFYPGDAQDLAERLRSTVTQASHWRAMGSGARQTYLARHHPSANLNRLIEIYDYAIAHPVHAGAGCP